MAHRRSDIQHLRDEVGTFDAPIGAVQLPSTGIRYDSRGNPKALQSGQDEHPDPAPKRVRRVRESEPELAFATDLFAADPAEQALIAACHKALAGAQLTEDELRRKLRKAGLDEQSVELGIMRSVAAGLIDDRRYAATYIESRVRRGHGAMRIRHDLARRGIDHALVGELLDEQVDGEAFDDAALDAARRKFARMDLEDGAVRARALRWLASRGYSGAQANSAIRTLRQEHAER